MGITAQNIRENGGKLSDKLPKDTNPVKMKPQGMTPMMAQYCEIKSGYSDSLLFYRMGDFYELFFADAEIASKALGIQLTKRGKHEGNDIPMCGVPVHSSDDYLERLIRAGFRVAVCEQVEDPAEAKKRGSKSIVKRDVVRVVTPGTLTEDSLLDSSQNNFLMAIKRDDKSTEAIFYLTCADISTGEFLLCQVNNSDLLGEIARLSPKEVLIADRECQSNLFQEISESYSVSPIPYTYFSSQSGERDLKKVLDVKFLEGLGDYSPHELSVIGALLKYIEITQIDKIPPLTAPKRQHSNNVMIIDAATRANLELVKSIRGEKEGSLLKAVDRTVTGPGGRVLAKWLSSPLSDPEAINQRFDVVSYFLKSATLRKDLRQALKGAPDIARSYSRLALERGGPRDLGAIKGGFEVSGNLSKALSANCLADSAPKILNDFIEVLNATSCELNDFLISVLSEELPLLKRDGGFVKDGFSKELDETRALKDESRKIIANMQSNYVEISKVKSLKIKYNNVLGYFIEVSASHGAQFMKPPLNETFVHRQTLANSIRFTTVELNEIQSKIISAGEKTLSLELEIFDQCLNLVREHDKLILQLADVLAQLDVLLSFAELADEQGYTRPIVDDSLVFNVINGRHPVVDMALQSNKQSQFIGNNCVLNGYSDNDKTNRNARIWMLTGPNMAGKSTFLRQNALIGILSHIGCFVPAETAHIGIIDRLFSRVGASDDLARGRSTFMVEMVETAAILNQATSRSFVILDEIGRGTSTYDGLSIAWATLEYLYEKIKCRSIFATHYHELSALTSKLEGAINVTMQVEEWNDEIIFLHKVITGAADRSYGVQVAKLAGLPKSVILRAREVLEQLEVSDDKRVDDGFLEDLPLFAIFSEDEIDDIDHQKKDDIAAMISELDPDELTPKAALDLLYELKKLSSQ